MAAVRESFHGHRVSRFAVFNRAHAVLYSAAVVSALCRRFADLFSCPSALLSSSLLLADVVLALMWLSAQAFRWRPVRRFEFPERLLREVPPERLPPLDVFICTADPHREPPVSVASTALSAMAFDYPTDKISVYVSDDGGSAMTLFAFMEAARFARYWLPFCKENAIAERSPEAYFASSKGGDSEKMKMMYETMKERVENALERGHVGDDAVSDADARLVFDRWKKFTRHDHPSVIKVLLESSKDVDIAGDALPNLVYISREKSPAAHHHFKAGALNVLTRVSSAMSNSPVILTLDCDMYSNNPHSPLHALCYFLDEAFAGDLAYVQFPQRFQGINRDDIYASEIKRLFTIHSRGMDGLRGPNYVGTGCFFARRSLHGARPSPSYSLIAASEADSSPPPSSPEDTLRRAHEGAACTYEDGTKWGSSIGFRYGSLVEDFHTGYRLQCEGWKAVLCDPARAAFLGDVPKNLNDAVSQCKRWVVGLYEVAFSGHDPLTFGARRISPLMGLCYAHYSFWGTWCVPVAAYGLLPQLSLVGRTPTFPKGSDPWFYLYAYLFAAAYCHDLAEFLADGGTVRRWWNEQRIWLIRGLTTHLFGTIQFAMNKMGVSAPGFNVTSKVKEEEQGERYERGEMDFGTPSPFFAVLGTVAVVNLIALAAGIARAALAGGEFDEMLAQLLLSAFVVANCRPIYAAMFVRSDGGKIPQKITVISCVLAGFLHLIGFLFFRGDSILKRLQN